MKTAVIAFLYIVELFIAINCLGDIVNEKFRKIYTVLIGALFYAFAFSVHHINENPILNIALFFTVNCLFAFLCFDCKALKAALLAFFLSATMASTEFISMTLLSWVYDGDINTYNQNIATYTTAVLLSKTLYFLTTKLLVYFGFGISVSKKMKTPPFLFLFPVCSIVILIAFWTISSSYELNGTIDIMITVSSITVLLSIILTYAFYGKTTRELDELYKAQKEAERVNADIAYYAILDKQNDKLKTFIHDEKNHLSVIKSLADNEEINEYVDKIYGEIAHYSMFGNTKNKMLDLMINKYQYICEAENIELYVSIKTANLLFIESPDLISLLGNLLDNAVEAAKSSVDRKIDLSINRVNGLDILTCTNSCDAAPQATGKNLKTTKNDDGVHGLGIRSIKSVVKKYKGNFEWNYDKEENSFTVYIAFKNKT
ncbi:MAG: GHKL domain-containing protein [Clostridia bacterium]|nr:GHKL domain-containing protein [Clostridia bacterium]